MRGCVVPLLQGFWHSQQLRCARPSNSACSLPVLVRAGTLSVPALVSLRKAARASTQAGGEAGPVPAHASMRLLGAGHLDLFGPGGWKHVAEQEGPQLFTILMLSSCYHVGGPEG